MQVQSVKVLCRRYSSSDRYTYIAINIYFSENGERDAVVYLAEGLDFVVGAWILAAELIAGEA
jgi:hypothetical protein